MITIPRMRVFREGAGMNYFIESRKVGEEVTQQLKLYRVMQNMDAYEWDTVLLASIAESLAIIADSIGKKQE